MTILETIFSIQFVDVEEYMSSCLLFPGIKRPNYNKHHRQNQKSYKQVRNFCVSKSCFTLLFLKNLWETRKFCLGFRKDDMKFYQVFKVI